MATAPARPAAPSRPAATAPAAKPATGTVDTAKLDKVAGNTTTGVVGSGTKQKYQTIVLGLGKSRKPIWDRINALALSLGCRASDLMWHGAEQLLANPPKAAPEGARSSSGSSPGFWVLHTKDENGRLSGVRVVEVEARGQINGGERMFVRYSADDAKTRERAMANALRAANYDLQLVGIKAKVEVEEFDGDEDYSAITGA